VSIKPLDSPSLTGLRRMPSRWVIASVSRRVAVLLIMDAVEIGAAMRARPAPGVHGAGLAVPLALAAVVVGSAAMVYSLNRPTRTHVWAMALLLLGAESLVWFQPSGTAGELCMTEALTLLAARLRRRPAVLTALTAAAFAALVAEMTLARHEPAESTFVLCFPMLSVGLLSVLVQRLRDAKERAESLLAQVEANRDAEARAAALAERQHLAREMHDVLAHSLSGLMLQLEGVRLLAGAGPTDPRLKQAADRAHELARDGLTEARHAISMLRDEQLPGPDALGTLADRFTEHTGIPCTFAVSGRPYGVRPDARLALYRVTQEALTNIVKHADAKRVEVRLTYDDEQVGLTIEDFADSLPATAPRSAGDDTVARASSGYGLTGMRERAELLGGTLHAGAMTSGFRVELRVPA
jgi:signal transduction histidine kinase